MSWELVSLVLGIIWAVVTIIALAAWYARGIGVSDDE